MRKYVALLRRRDYRLLWLGATASALGDGMSFVALVWLLLERGGDSATIGWLAAAYTGPVVVGGIATGLILDRFDKRRVLIVDNVVRGIAIASIPFAGLLLSGGDPVPAIAVMAAFMLLPASVALFVPALSPAATG